MDMPRFKFQKLVRDKIISHQLASGATPVARQLQGPEYVQALLAKLSEEAAELADASAETLAEELADVQQVIDDLRLHLGVTPEALAEVQARKTAKNGDFRNGDFVESVEVAEDNPWTAYYRAHPEQYPELTD